jgi:hypothetical protein
MGFITGWGEGPMFVLVIIALRPAESVVGVAGEFCRRAANFIQCVAVQSLKKLVFASHHRRPMGVIEWSQTLLGTDLDLPAQQFAFLQAVHYNQHAVWYFLPSLLLHWARRPAIQVFARSAPLPWRGLQEFILMAHCGSQM